MRSISKTYAALILLTVFLAGCDSPEERAEAHYQRAMALLAEGDATSAQIEFRNALQQDQALSKARLEYARSLASEGNAREAAGHYLRLVEQNPDDGVSHLELARLAIGMGDFQTASTHVRRAFELLPDDPGAKELMATVVFREGDPERGVAMANEVLAETPSSVPARLVLIAERMSAEDFATALDITEAALADAPDDPDLNVARLALLERLGDTQGVGEQLGRMLDADPDNQQTAQALLRWHLSQGDEASALALLRDIAERSPEDPTGRLNVAQFMLETDGPEAARAELQRLVDTEAENAPYLQALAQLDFALGRREEAIAGLRTLTSVEEDSPELRDLRVALARMLLATAERDEAATLVDAVLAADPQHVEALKMRARRSIDADSPEQALLDLNSALARAPDDPDILTLMAEAHEREGAHDLAGQRLARAVEASDFRAAESLRYAGYLVADGRLGPAEDTLLDALRRAPQNLDLLSLLGRVHLEREDYGRVRQLAGTIRETGVTGSAELANGLELAALQAEGRTEEMVGALSELATDGSEDIRPKLALIQTHLASGDTDAASDVVDQLLAEDPAQSRGPVRAGGGPGHARRDRRGRGDVSRPDRGIATSRGRPSGAGRPAGADRTRRGGGSGAGRRHRRHRPRPLAPRPRIPASDGRRGFRGRHRDLRGALRARHVERRRREQSGQPSEFASQRSGEPRSRLPGRETASRLRESLFPGHLWLASDRTWRLPAGSDLSGAGGGRPDVGRPDAVPSGRDLFRARALGRRARGVRDGGRSGRTG